MKLRSTMLTILALGLPFTQSGSAQEQGAWRPAGRTAQSITGGIAIGNEKLTINFLTVPLAEIRALKPAELTAAFDSADAAPATGHLFRLSIPGDKRFLHKNTLCGSEETQWMVTRVSGKELTLAFFSNGFPPVFTAEALNNNPNLCGTYSYVR